MCISIINPEGVAAIARGCGAAATLGKPATEPIDEALLNAVRQFSGVFSGVGSERKIIETAIREWLNKQQKGTEIIEDDNEWQVLQRQKMPYVDKYPPSTIEPPGTPSFYKGRTISIDEMTESAKRAVGKRFKNA